MSKSGRRLDLGGLDMALWQVTTEGDCEGRTMKDLGYYEGNPVDIAFVLADKAMYSLTFSEVVATIVTPDELDRTRSEEVSITFAMDSKYSNVEDIAHFIKWLFIEHRPVHVAEMRAFNSVRLKKGVPDKSNALDLARERALSKLSQEEKVLLGLV